MVLYLGSTVDTSIHSGALWCIYIYALNCRIYGRLSTSSAVEFMVDKLDVGVEIYFEKCIPICSMYGIFTYIWVIFSANVGI